MRSTWNAIELFMVMLLALTWLAYAQTPPTFVTTGNLLTGRNGHGAILLEDGSVLVAGGYDVNENALAACELYDPATGTFAATGSLNVARRNFGMVLLGDGTVLITGGYDNNFRPLSSAELYDPKTRTFTLVGSLLTARASHMAVLLNNGTVLIAGGFDQAGNGLSSAELYLPSRKVFVPTGAMSTPRAMATATPLDNDLVLIAGGSNGQTHLASAELYDLRTGKFYPTGSLHVARTRDTATLLDGGKVLLTGGEDSAGNILASAEVYDFATKRFEMAGPLNNARGDHAATLLMDGTVLVEGGFAEPGPVDMFAGAEIYNPSTRSFKLTGSLNVARQVQSASMLFDGSVLVAAGWSGYDSGLTSAELYKSVSSRPRDLVRIKIYPEFLSVPAGTLRPLSAWGIFRNGSVRRLASVLWRSSTASVATVTPHTGDNGPWWGNERGGFVYAIRRGVTRVRACAGRVCGGATVRVR